MSWGGGESSGETSSDSYFTTPAGHTGVTFLASSGDTGAPDSYPSASPNVVSVGGTSLYLTAQNNYSSESGWNGSGGGISADEAQPAYQQGVVTQSSSYRTNPDVSYDADPNTGFPVYDTLNNGTSAPWGQWGGTSDAAPQWAALIAIADQGRAVYGKSPLDGPTQTLPTLYSLPAGDYHDITTGTSTGSPNYSAGAGYDLVTGIGTPYANLIVPALVGPTGLMVNGTLPAAGSEVFTPPTTFTVTTSDAVNLASLQAGEFLVNGIPATSVSYTPGSTTITFGYGTSPVTAQGLESMQINAGAFTRQSDGSPVQQFSATFRYAAVLLQVASTTPAVNGTFTMTPPLVYDVNFNTQVLPSSVSTSSLSLVGISGEYVASATVLPGNTTVEFTLGGSYPQGTLTASIVAGAITDPYGNPSRRFFRQLHR